jgi:hypothetical protein
MSMSEFNRQMNSENDDSFSLSELEQAIPTDFGEEDLAFAQELNTIFSAEKEELPPYFVQTLLASEESLFQPVESGFEHKTRARVFRRLKLRRRLFNTPRSAFSAFITGISSIYARGSLLASMAAFTLIMLVTVAFTAPSFASGMAILLHGARSGVYRVHDYPKVVHTVPQTTINDQSEQIPLSEALQQLHFRMYWPQSLPSNYSLDSIYLYQATDQGWADGPIIELVYDLSGVTPKGTGEIVIREFKPNEDVFQLVQDRAVHPIQIEQDGLPKAIYVDGQWISRGRFLPKWAYGERSELIYQQNGVVFWIAGDQYDGIGEKALWNTAQSLQLLPYSRLMLMRGDTTFITRTSLSTANDPFSTDVLAINREDSPDGAYFINVSSYQSEKPLQKPVTHGH